MQLPWLPEYGLAKGNLVRSLFKGWAGANPAPLMAEVEVYKEALGQPYAARRALDHLRQYRSFGKKERLLFHQKLRVPVLTIQGEIDPVMPAQAFARDNHHVAGLLRQVSVPGAGHFPARRKPGWFSGGSAPVLGSFCLTHCDYVVTRVGRSAAVETRQTREGGVIRLVAGRVQPKGIGRSGAGGPGRCYGRGLLAGDKSLSNLPG